MLTNFRDPASPIFNKIWLWLPKVPNKSKQFDLLWQFGPVAHLVEHIICNDGVAGSSPVGSTINAERRFCDLEIKSGRLYVRTRRPVITFCAISNKK